MHLPNQIGDNPESESILTQKLFGSHSLQQKNIEYKHHESFTLTFSQKLKPENFQFPEQKRQVWLLPEDNKTTIESFSQNNTQNHLDSTKVETFLEVSHMKTEKKQEEVNLLPVDDQSQRRTEINTSNDNKVSHRPLTAIILQKSQDPRNNTTKPEPITSSSPTSIKGRNKNESSERVTQAKQEQKEEAICRICLESEQNNEIGKLIVPCRCAGSMKWIHDECLKTWIISKEQNMNKASCELCNGVFNMKFQYKSKFYPKVACEEGVVSLVTCICLTLVVIGLVTVIIYFGAIWNHSSDSDGGGAINTSTSSLKLAIILTCSIITLILTVIIVFSFREACFVVEVAEWTILPRSTQNCEADDFQEFDKEENNSPHQSSQVQRMNLSSLRANIERRLFRGEQFHENSVRIDVTSTNRTLSSNNDSFLGQSDAHFNENIQQHSRNNSRVSDAVIVHRRQSQEGLNLLNSSVTLRNGNEEEEKSVHNNSQVLDNSSSSLANLTESRSIVLPSEKMKSSSTKFLIQSQTDKHIVGGKIIEEEKPKKLIGLQEFNIVPTWQKSSSQGSIKSLNELRDSKNSQNFRTEKYGGTLLYQQIPKEFINDNETGTEKKIEVRVGISTKRVSYLKTKSDSNLLRQSSSVSNISAKSGISKPKQLEKARSSLTIKSKYSKK